MGSHTLAAMRMLFALLCLEIVSRALGSCQRDGKRAGAEHLLFWPRTWMAMGMGLCAVAATKSEADNKRDHLFSFALGTFISAACVTLNISGRSKHAEMKRELQY